MPVGPSPSSSSFASRFAGGSLVLADLSLYPEQVWFVGPITRADGTTVTTGSKDQSNYGRNPNAPFLTLKYALSQVGPGDAILITPGHTETFTGAAVSVVDAGVKIIGIGQGLAAPHFSYGDASSPLNFTVDGVSIDNCVFLGNSFASVASMLGVSAANCAIRKCRFMTGDATNQAVLGILTTNGANRLKVKECYFHGTSDAGTTAAIRIVGGNGVHVEACDFYGAYTSGVGAIQSLTTDTVGAFILANAISNITAGSTKAMVFTAGSTGMVGGNILSILSGTSPITGAAMFLGGANFYSNSLGGGATLL